MLHYLRRCVYIEQTVTLVHVHGSTSRSVRVAAYAVSAKVDIDKGYAAINHYLVHAVSVRFTQLRELRCLQPIESQAIVVYQTSSVEPTMLFAAATACTLILLISLIGAVRWIVKNDPILRDD